MTRWRSFLNKISLRTTLIVPISTISILALLISVLISYQSTARLTSDFFSAQALLIAKSITKQLEDFFSNATRILEVNKDLIESRHLDTADTNALGAQFLTQIKANPYMTYVSMGFPDGSYVGGGRYVSTGDINLYLANLETDFAFTRYGVQDNTLVMPPLEVGNRYDATKRGWYQSALEANKTRWYPVYKYINQDALGMGVSTPVYLSGTTQALGVITADLALNRINTFLTDLAIKGGEIFFVSEPDGTLVATNLTPGAYFAAQEGFERYTLNSYPDDRLQAASRRLNAPHSQSETMRLIVGHEAFRFMHIDYRDAYGLELVIGVLLSESDYAGIFKREFFLRMINAATFMIMLGIIVLFVIERSILPPVKRLVEAHKVVRSGDFQTKVPLSGSRELVELAKGFNDTVDALESADGIQRSYIEHEKMATLGGLVSGVTHEVNTPLGLAITMSSFIEKSFRDTAKQVLEGKITKSDFAQEAEQLGENFEILQTNLQRAAELVNSFKALAVGQSHESELRFNFKRLLEDVLTSIRHIIRQKAHQIEIVCDENLFVTSYPGALMQIFTNLIINSVIHGFKDLEHGTIEIAITQEENRIRILYKDNGRGMTPEVLNNIFTPFFTTNRENGGTGIGMNIIQNIVTEQLKGTITVESSPNKGVVFTILF